nr:hypothetical protein [uncultured Nitrososphaera sp.]
MAENNMLRAGVNIPGFMYQIVLPATVGLTCIGAGLKMATDADPTNVVNMLESFGFIAGGGMSLAFAMFCAEINRFSRDFK